MVLKNLGTKSSSNSKPRITIDFSGITQWLSCGEQYRRVNIEKKKQKPTIALIEGSGTHEALKINNLHKRKKGSDLSAKKMTDISVNYLEEKLKEPNIKNNKKWFWQDEKKDRVTSRAKIWFHNYAKVYAPKIEPVIVEQPMIIPVEVNGKEFELAGVIDLTDPKMLIDYKTSKSVKSQKEIDSSLQMTIYSFFTKLRKVQYINFVKSANPYIAQLKSTRTPLQWQWGLMIAQRVVQAIDSGNYPLADPDPRNWRCSEKFCGFWKNCRGKYER